MKSGSPSRTTAAHKTQTKSPGLVLSRLPMSSLLLLFLPKLLRGTRDRWVAQVSFIIIHSTGLAPFPRLSAPPHSSHTPIAPRRPGGTPETAPYPPPPPPSPGVCDEWGGAESRGNGARPVEWMIMNDTCATALGPAPLVTGNKILFFKNILTFYQILILNGSYYRYYVAKCKYVNSLMKS